MCYWNCWLKLFPDMWPPTVTKQQRPETQNPRPLLLPASFLEPIGQSNGVSEIDMGFIQSAPALTLTHGRTPRMFPGRRAGAATRQHAPRETHGSAGNTPSTGGSLKSRDRTRFTDVHSWTFEWKRTASCPGERPWKHRASTAASQAPQPGQSSDGWAAGSWTPPGDSWALFRRGCPGNRTLPPCCIEQRRRRPRPLRSRTWTMKGFLRVKPPALTCWQEPWLESWSTASCTPSTVSRYRRQGTHHTASFTTR